MSSYVGARLQITTRDGKYEGTLRSINPITKMVSLEQAKALPSGQKYLGLLNFYGQEITNLQVLEENDLPQQVAEIQKQQQQKQQQQVESGLQSQGVTSQEQHSDEVFDNYQDQPASDVNWPADVDPPYSQEDSIPYEQGQSGNPSSSEISSTKVAQDISEKMEDINLHGQVPSRQMKQSELPTHNMTSLVGSRIGSHVVKYTFIDKQDENFFQAMEDMKEQDAIGLVLKGVQLGRKGRLSITLVLCEDRLYMFDAVALGPLLFTQDFIDVLETDTIAKVVHDCRFVSDLLYHKYGILLASVFDTQVGDVLIRRRQYMGDFPRTVNGMTECILEYLDISIQDIAMHLENTKKISDDESSWLQRPLPAVNIRCAYLDSVYLLRLREAITEQLMAEFTCAIDICLAVERDRLEVDTKKISSRASYVPWELVNNLHRKVSELGASTIRVRPPELAQPNPSSGTGMQRPKPGQTSQSSGRPGRTSPGTGRGSRLVTGQKMPQQQQREKRGGSQDGQEKILPWRMQATSQGLTAKPVRGQPRIPPLMTHSKLDDDDDEEEDGDDISSENSQDSEGDAFDNDEYGQLWQQRYEHKYAASPEKVPLGVEQLARADVGALDHPSSGRSSSHVAQQHNRKTLPEYDRKESSYEPGHHVPETMGEAFSRLQPGTVPDTVHLGSPQKTNHMSQGSSQSEDQSPNKFEASSASPIAPAMLGPRGRFKGRAVTDSSSNVSAWMPTTERGEPSPQRDQGRVDFSVPYPYSADAGSQDLQHGSADGAAEQGSSRVVVDNRESRDKTLRLTDMRQNSAPVRKMRDDLGIVSGVPRDSDVYTQPPSYADALSGKKRETLKVPKSRTLKALGKALAAGEILEDDDIDDIEDKEEDHNNSQRTAEVSEDRTRPSPSRGRGRASLLNPGHADQHLRMLPNRSPGGLTARVLPQTVKVSFPSGQDDDQQGASMNGCFLSQRAL